MRDIVLIVVVCGSLPFILRRPWIGVLVWSWLGFMNPHRFTWGFAYEFPFSQLVAIATIAGLLFTSQRRAPPLTAMTVVWLLFIVWLNVTTPFALYPDDALAVWDKAMKVQLFAFITMLLIFRKDQIVLLVWVIALSLGFFGVKGGIFAAATGGAERVYGPPGSFFDDNNAVGLVLIMAVPLMRFLQLQVREAWQRHAFTGVMLLTAGAILSTHSRGALLAGAAMVATLILKSRRKVAAGLAALATLPVLVLAMPERWFERMGTIAEYQEDGSAMGRINAWWFAWNLAKDRPLTGGGFEAFRPDLFLRYAPNPEQFHDAHSIYFEVLGEHGFPGLLLFLTLAVLGFLTARRIERRVRDAPSDRAAELVWARDLAAMVQVSIVGYAVGGAFLGLAYFDLYYTLLAILLILHRYLETALSERLALPEALIATASPPAPRDAPVERPNPYEGGGRAHPALGNRR